MVMKKMKVVAGPALSEEEARKYGEDVLAMGTPLEYLRFERDKRTTLYEYNNFGSKREAINKGNQLIAKGAPDTNIVVQQCVNGGYRLILDDLVKPYFENY